MRGVVKLKEDMVSTADDTYLETFMEPHVNDSQSIRTDGSWKEKDSDVYRSPGKTSTTAPPEASSAALSTLWVLTVDRHRNLQCCLSITYRQNGGR
ncbi:hypothetical protein NDU88_001760 [Pleurodeles waltl]|uniref:Uncharacterized protein n=1 Tax=Pleurodeles waltl TaxID=8319 RepID=A0AAV7SAZ7_PLEWA|nr:hypothetical protein NDU88_001760 [Pleurodeles waltl]